MIGRAGDLARRTAALRLPAGSRGHRGRLAGLPIDPAHAGLRSVHALVARRPEAGAGVRSRALAAGPLLPSDFEPRIERVASCSPW